jgi:hypothetical protein
MPTLPDTLIREIADWLMGTCYSATAAADHFEIDSTDLEDNLLDVNTEQCKGCGWWFESGELTPDDDENDDEVGYCSDCRRSS